LEVGGYLGNLGIVDSWVELVVAVGLVEVVKTGIKTNTTSITNTTSSTSNNQYNL
jgi:hypothetical protein